MHGRLIHLSTTKPSEAPSYNSDDVKVMLDNIGECVDYAKEIGDDNFGTEVLNIAYTLNARVHSFVNGEFHGYSAYEFDKAQIDAWLWQGYTDYQDALEALSYTSFETFKKGELNEIDKEHYTYNYEMWKLGESFKDSHGTMIYVALDDNEARPIDRFLRGVDCNQQYFVYEIFDLHM